MEEGKEVSVNEEQPAPKANDGMPVWEVVVQDMAERDRVGRERYGTPLQTNNGRNPLVDAYQEALDLVVYLRQAILEKGETVPGIPHRLALDMENKRLREFVTELQTRNTQLRDEWIVSQDKVKRLEEAFSNLNNNIRPIHKTADEVFQKLTPEFMSTIQEGLTKVVEDEDTGFYAMKFRQAAFMVISLHKTLLDAVSALSLALVLAQQEASP